MKVYIVRHGQTEWNRQLRWQGNLDIPLNGTGVEQALQLAEGLTDLYIHKIYTSPLARAMETARIIQHSLNADITIRDDMREIRMGEWSGLTLGEMKDTYGGLFDEWNLNEAAQIGYGVENYRDLQRRALAAVEDICGSENEPVLLVAHGTWISALICGVLHIPMRFRNSFEISNAGISILDYDGDTRTLKVVSLNSMV